MEILGSSNFEEGRRIDWALECLEIARVFVCVNGLTRKPELVNEGGASVYGLEIKLYLVDEEPILVNGLAQNHKSLDSATLFTEQEANSSLEVSYSNQQKHQNKKTSPTSK